MSQHFKQSYQARASKKPEVDYLIIDEHGLPCSAVYNTLDKFLSEPPILPDKIHFILELKREIITPRYKWVPVVEWAPVVEWSDTMSDPFEDIRIFIETVKYGTQAKRFDKGTWILYL